MDYNELIVRLEETMSIYRGQLEAMEKALKALQEGPEL